MDTTPSTAIISEGYTGKCELHITADNMAGLWQAVIAALPMVNAAILKHVPAEDVAQIGTAQVKTNFIFS